MSSFAIMRPHRPKRLTAQHLENVALHYLQRFATSSGNLRRVLMRRVEKAARAAAEDAVRDEGAALVEALIARWQASGLLDDAAYAEAKVYSLRRRGASARAIRQTLAAKGIAGEAAEDCLSRLGAADAEAELAAAVALARRRRLGPWRPAEARAAMRLKDVAALARAGFGYDLAIRVIDGETEDLLRF